MFLHRETIGRVELAFTDRSGGASDGPWASLNLGTSNGDDPATVSRNLATVTAELGLDRLVRMTQVHGADVAWTHDLGDGEIPVADALFTDEPGVGVLVRVADCTPVVLVGHDHPVAGVVHCGREGLVKGVVPAAVAALRGRGVESIAARVGPRACGRCYELPQEMADAVAEVVPEARSTTSWGTPAIDVGAGVVAQLRELGVDDVTDLGEHDCTIEDERFFSYRRQGQDSGRFGAVAMIRA
ncbi:polyphenol oxidase family protein [Aeromicrobium sp. NPDC092404]|uniref:polyphenol oxidase family protein n=1 Tax=Aeromicrobium sp. NPDC092404 TaxID=3154976 RepID=UPI0034406439